MTTPVFTMEQFAKTARAAAAEGCVLLRNENRALPLEKDCRVAVFGRTQMNDFKSGLGSGGLVNARYVVGVYQGLKESGLVQVDLPKQLTSIGDYAFDNCDNLGGLTLGYDGTTTFPSIGTGVFNDCDNFSYIKVREGVYNSFIDKATNNQLGWGAYNGKIITGPY